MKLKILAVPLLIVLIITISIWAVQPVYSTVLEKRENYLRSVEKLNDISEKLANAEKLSEELAQMGEERNIIEEYLPGKNEEEYIINYFNDLALREGMAILALTLNERAGQPSPPVVDEFGNPTIEIDTTPKAKYIDADFSVMGGYEKVKSFLGKLDSLKRFNNISAINISKNFSAAEGNKGSDMLLVKAVSGFGFLERIKTVTNIGNKTVSSDKFDLSIADKIKNNKNTETSALILDTIGKANPFLP